MVFRFAGNVRIRFAEIYRGMIYRKIACRRREAFPGFSHLTQDGGYLFKVKNAFTFHFIKIFYFSVIDIFIESKNNITS